MKRLFILFIFSCCVFICSSQVTISSKYANDIDLNGVLSAFCNSHSIEEFEESLNSPDLQLSTLDINMDGYVDYLKCYELDNYAYINIEIYDYLYNDSICIATIVMEKSLTPTVIICGNRDIFINTYIYYSPLSYCYFAPRMHYVRQVYRYPYRYRYDHDGHRMASQVNDQDRHASRVAEPGKDNGNKRNDRHSSRTANSGTNRHVSTQSGNRGGHVNNANNGNRVSNNANKKVSSSKSVKPTEKMSPAKRQSSDVKRTGNNGSRSGSNMRSSGKTSNNGSRSGSVKGTKK